jgi:DNA-binding response OmpR family regulator
MASASSERADPGAPEIILVVEQDVLVRASLSDYLRSCGYRVFEARDFDEAVRVLQESKESVDVVLSDQLSGFKLSTWARQNHAGVDVLMTGTVERAANAAADLCAEGPAKARPLEPQQLVKEIRRALARRDRS